MASWTDGPEYAPAERPDVFVAPDAAPPLPSAWPAPAPGHGDPASPPPAFQPAPDAVPLDALAPPPGPQRDPHEAFDVVTTPLTTWQAPTAAASAPAIPPPGAPAPVLPTPPASGPAVPAAAAEGWSPAWGAAHAATHAPPPQPGAGWAPEEPFPAAPLPPPTHYPAPGRDWPPPQINPADFPPPPGNPWQPAAGGQAPTGPQPVTFERVINGVTPGVLIALAVGMFVGPLSGVMYFAAWVLASRVRYRRALIARLFSTGAFGMLGVGFVVMWLEYGAFDLIGWFESSVLWAQLANLLVGVASILVVRNAIARGEPPEPTAPS